MIKVCAICGKEFEANHGRCKYCSDDCKRIAKHQNNRKWYQNHKEKHKEHNRKYRQVRRKNMIKVCDICGSKFETPNSRRKYCSDDCKK